MKTKTRKFRRSAAAILLGLGLAGTSGTVPAAEKEQENLTAAEMNLASKNEIIPQPGEVFSVLSSVDARSWEPQAESTLKAIQPLGELTTTEAAVILGRRSADAFLAIQARNKDLLKVCFEQILESGRKLGAADTLLDKGQSVMELAEDGKWNEVAGALDGLQLEIETAMAAVDDTESAAIAGAAGWIRGLAIFTNQLAVDYSPEASRALRQDQLAQSLETGLQGLPESIRTQLAVAEMIRQIDAIKPLLDISQEGTVDVENVKKIAELTSPSEA